MRVWTIDKIAAYFKEEDPNTTINATAIRRLVRSGAIPSAMIGNRYCVTVEAVEAYFSGASTGAQNQPVPEHGTIRTVPERIPN